MIFVTYKIQDGEHEYFDYSWFSKLGTQSDYDTGAIKDKVLIEEVYGEAEQETNKYFVRDWDTYIQVYAVKNITPKELHILDKVGVVAKRF